MPFVNIAVSTLAPPPYPQKKVKDPEILIEDGSLKYMVLLTFFLW